MRLAVVCTHPIQYYAPVFKLMAQNIELKVFYTASRNEQYDPGFQQNIHWDIPLLDGYNYEFLINIAKQPGSHHFMGIRNPDAVKHIIDFKADYILIYGWAYYSHLKILHYFKGKTPILFRGDSTLLNLQPGFKCLIKKTVLRWIYQHVDKALYVGTNNKAYFKKYGIKEEQLIFAPHAVDNIRFAEEAQLYIRANLKLLDKDVLVAYAGKFDFGKNPGILLRAFLDLNLPNTHLLFAGSGILESQLKSESSQFKNVHFMPFQNQSTMPAIYQSCDLFCFPSNNDTWGMAINEAMAAGKAILASDKTGAAVDLVQNTNGRIFKSNNLHDLKEKLKELISNPEDLRLKGKASSNIISQWSFEIQTKNILDAID